MTSPKEGDAVNDLLVIRVLFIAVLGCAAFVLKPFNLSAPIAAAVGAAAVAGAVTNEEAVKLPGSNLLAGRRANRPTHQ